MVKQSQEIEKMKDIDMYMIATTATHQLGDLTRELDVEGQLMENLCRISKEDDENYYGMWTTGMGFFNVEFPKDSTRELTQEEIDFFNTKSVQISSQPPVKLKVD